MLAVWVPPILLMVTTTLLAIPLSRYMAFIMDGKYRTPGIFRWIEKKLDSGPQTWRQYTASLLIFNTLLFVFGFLVLALQPWLPLNPDGKGLLAPSTVFNSVISFMTNTDIQHYAGEVHFSNFSQIFFAIANMFMSASVGFCALVAIIRAFRGETTVGNYFLDMWRVCVYQLVPVAFLLAILFIREGCPMTLQAACHVRTVESGTQTIVLGPVAALESIKMLGTNGGGFYGANAAHPFENPTATSNFFNAMAMMLFPFSLVLMYGHMLSRMRHAAVVFGVMAVMMAGSIAWTISLDTLQPNPGFAGQSGKSTYEISDALAPNGKRTITIPQVAGLPLDQHLGNLEGKELRFGTSAGATYATVTVDVTCGSEDAEPDSLNPAAALGPMTGMWLNCIFGGKGVGMINMLVYIIIGIFIAGMMVGRSPEYLGRKIGAKEVKLAIIALLVHPFMILLPSGLFAAVDWRLDATSNPGPHAFSQILYEFSSASANNGSAFDGLKTTYGFADNPAPPPSALPLDIAVGLVMLFARFLPVIAPIAMAASLGAKKAAPAGLGTLRDDTLTFSVLLLGTILVVGALLFMPFAMLGPVAEHLGPIPFGG